MIPRDPLFVDVIYQDPPLRDTFGQSEPLTIIYHIIKGGAMTYKRRINVRGIIFKNGKLFCQQLTQSDDKQPRNYWCTPGGGMDDGESPTQALHREMIEETGIAPVIGKLLFMQQFHDGTKEQLEFFFHIENADDYSSIDLTTTSHGVEEIEVCDFVDPATTQVLPVFLQTIDIADYIAGERSVHIYSEM